MTADATRRCPDCGAENALDAVTCAECNHPLTPIATVEPAPGGEPSGGWDLRTPSQRPPRRPPAGPGIPGVPEVSEEPGRVIPRRRHARAGLFGMGAGAPEQPGGAPSWIWMAVAGAALVITVVAALRISTQKPPLSIPNASREQARAADSLVRVLDRDSLDIQANIALGNLMYDTGNFGAAVRYYRRALSAHPDLPDVRVDMAVSLHQSGHTAEAIAELEQVIAAHPGHPIARLDLGIIYESLGQLDEAEKAYRAAQGLQLSHELRHVVDERLQALVQARAAGAGAAAGGGSAADTGSRAPGGRGAGRAP